MVPQSTWTPNARISLLHLAKNKYRGDYSNQEKALDASLNACDGGNNVGYTIWTYVAVGGSALRLGREGEREVETRHTHEWGDGWNGEDLSLWSADDLRRKWLTDADADSDSASDAKEMKSTLNEGRKRVSLTRLTRKREEEEERFRSESRAALLANRSTPNLGSKNPSVLTLNTINTALPLNRAGVGEDSPVLLTPSASTPTLLVGPGLGLGLKKKLSGGGLSAHMVDGVGMQGTNTSTTAINPTNNSSSNPSSKDKDSSSYSSSTLLSHHSSSDEELAKAQKAAEADPYDFLTDGARAVRAFCRPRVVRVWGEVKDMEFGIGKAEFRCSIRRPSATAATTPRASEGAAKSGVKMLEDTKEEATQIYLPLVHFASDAVLTGSKAKRNSEKRASASVKAAAAAIGDGMVTPGLYGLEAAHDSPSDSGADADNDAPKGVKKTFFESVEERVDLLDVEVKVSEGRWEIRGQTLYWWYTKDGAEGSEGSASAGGGEGEEVNIEVKRRGGAIRVQRGGWVDVKSSSDADLKLSNVKSSGSRRGAEEKGWCERLCACDLGCVVM